jgi:hypothetical protein
MENKSGGFLVGRKNGKVYVHNDGSMGGYLVGRRHSQGGIKGTNQSTGQPIEVESGEIQISSNAVKGNEVYTLNGKRMSSRDVLSFLNVQGGGVSFEGGGNVENEINDSKNLVDKGAGKPIVYNGGEIILTRGAVSSDKKYNFNGKEMTTREIASAINVKGGGVSFDKGGDIKKDDCGCSDKYEKGGMTYEEFQAHRLKEGIKKERHDHYDTLSKLNAGTLTIDNALREIAQKEMTIDKNYPFSE